MGAMFTSSRELFEAAMEASRDACYIATELREAEHTSGGMGSPSLEAHVRMTRSTSAVEKAAITNVSREAAIQRRLDEDYQLIDSACEILYGRDQISDGLSTIYKSWVADAIYHHYLALRTWDETARMLGYSTSWVKANVRAAFELMDANGMAATVAGLGMAEG